MSPTFKTLDIFFYRGHKLISKIVRIITSVRYGIPYNETMSHIAIGCNEWNVISAETSGTKIMPNNEKTWKSDKCDVMVYRFNNINQTHIIKLTKIIPNLLNVRYAYARYGLDLVRILTFIFTLFSIFLGWISFKILLCLLSVIIVLQISSKYLRKYDQKQSDCAELSAIILNELKLMPHFSSKPRNEFPNSQMSKMEMLVWFGHAVKIYEWNYKSYK
jgi:hypothetical protein